MPPRARRGRLSERRAVATSTGAGSDAKPSEVFHFVSVNPSSEFQKSENRSVIRSHASKYIWRQHRASRTDGNNPNSSTAKSVPSRKQLLIAPTSSYGAAKETPWPLLSDGTEGEEPVLTLAPPDEYNMSPSDDEDTVNSREIQPVDNEVDNNGGVSWFASNNQLAQSSMESAAVIYADERNTMPGPFNQLMAFIGEPANTFPSMLGGSSVSKLMRYAIFDLWPGLVLGAGNKKWTQEDVAQSWLPRAMSHPALFTAFLYGAAGHLQTRQRLESAIIAPQTREEKLEQIVCETETIKQLNKMMLDPQQTALDEVILAVLCMAFNKTDYSKWTSDIDPAPKAPLRNLQWLQVYGGLSLNDQHVKGLLALIQTRGGLDQLKLPGLAETLSVSSIMLSTKYLAKPRLPFFPIFKDSTSGKTPKWPNLSSHTCPMPINITNPASNIQPSPAPYRLNNSSNNSKGINTSSSTETTSPGDIFARSNIPTALATVLRQIQNYSTVVNLHSQGLLPYLELAVIADRRNWVQYELLSLKSIHELKEETEVVGPSSPTSISQQPYNYKIYEPLRLTALIYSMLVIYPLPPAKRPFPRLCRMLKAALVAADIGNITPNDSCRNYHCWTGAAEMLLWVTMLGTMAARNTPSEDWYVERCRDVMRFVGVRSWEQLKAVMITVMWMDCVCDMGGMAVWLEVGVGNWSDIESQHRRVGNGSGIPLAERDWLI
ncbi:conserved hypothetical protein [Histoplasma capsulatum var. duboisii H88]|uniref:Uncharacterized protein n=2 Tax=Ajellomyces capsulatus TaxID=5037 RepID=F0UIQ7_AJEC8|nr:conserved hypothetical protein [Histoplasma capsulatum H143]EGC45610.1 conserved hypothetical protein [Histoplasma capsulatum var. duboisii H88]QSS56263.1 hypothetical protein I7I53_04430 [Histoplasma capsulatum var. duboisii H88]